MMRRMKVNPVPWALPGDIDCGAWRRLDALFCSNDSRYPVSPHQFVTPTVIFVGNLCKVMSFCNHLVLIGF